MQRGRVFFPPNELRLIQDIEGLAKLSAADVKRLMFQSTVAPSAD